MIAIASTVNMPHEKWLECRRMGIGGSDASVICGVNKYKSPVELWAEKTGEVPESAAGEPAYWGNTLEPVIRAEFTKRTGIEVTTVNQILRSREYPFMLANLDGVCRHPVYGKCVFEAKTATVYKACEWDNDSVPYEYILQVQHYMAVTGYMAACVAVLIGGNNFQIRFIERDEELISMLIRMERDFWNRVLDGVPPDIDGTDACTSYLNKRFPQGILLSTITLPDNAGDLIREYTKASAELDKITHQKQRAANMLKDMLGTNESGMAGSSVVTWKNVTQERFDSKLLESEQPDIYKKYVRKTTYRRFIVKDTALEMAA